MKLVFRILFIFLQISAEVGFAAGDSGCDSVLTSYALQAQYQGEENGMFSEGIPPFQMPKEHFVKYLTKEEADGHRLTMRGGRVFAGDRQINCGFSGCRRIFVLDPSHRILVGVGRIDEFHHSSLAGGQNVYAAGEIRFRNDQITYFSNKSGHYRPKSDSNILVLEALLELGFPPPERIGFYDSLLPTPFLFSTEMVSVFHTAKAMKAWREGRDYRLRGVRPEDIERLKALLMK